MAKNTPSFQFYPSDFLGGVMMLNEEETGVYIKLLCALWIQGNSVPFRFSVLARVTATPQDIFENVWPKIEDKFIIQDGNVMHARFDKMMNISHVNRENGSLGGRPKTKYKTEIKTETKTEIETEKETESEAKTLKYEERRMKNEKRKRKGVPGEGDSEVDDWVLPDGWDFAELRQALDDFAAMRQRIKSPIRSKKSTSKLFKRFDSPEHLIAVCEICEANEWKGLKTEYAPQKATQNAPRKGFLTTAQQREANMADVYKQIVDEKENDDQRTTVHGTCLRVGSSTG